MKKLSCVLACLSFFACGACDGEPVGHLVDGPPSLIPADGGRYIMECSEDLDTGEYFADLQNLPDTVGAPDLLCDAIDGRNGTENAQKCAPVFDYDIGADEKLSCGDGDYRFRFAVWTDL